MATAMQTSKCSVRTSVQSRSPAPFRAASQAVPQSRRTIVVKASQEPATDLAKKAVAALAAAAVAMTPMAAFATEKGNLMPQRNRAEDTAARAAMDASEKKGSIIPGRGQEDPNSGKTDKFFNAGGAAQADMRQAAGQRGDKAGPGKGSVSIERKLSDLGNQATKGAKSASGLKAQDKMDEEKALRIGNDRSKPVAWNGAALQVNVGQSVFGRGETGTTREQTNKGIQDLKDNLTNPGQNAKNALDRTGQEANRVLSNPTGGADQSKKAAQQLADANAEVPNKIKGGVQQAKDAVTGASFSGFDTAALQHNVRMGDLQSITGAQSKKATLDQSTTASDTASGDAQTTVDKSTSGVKARAASSGPSLGGDSNLKGAGGAADRAEKRFENEDAAKDTPKTAGNEGFRV